MPTKEEIPELMKQVPDGLAVDEALEQLQLLYDVQQGLQEAERGEPVSHDAAKQMIDKWLQ
jgi:predicted transcriptional regulator